MFKHIKTKIFQEIILPHQLNQQFQFKLTLKVICVTFTANLIVHNFLYRLI